MAVRGMSVQHHADERMELLVEWEGQDQDDDDDLMNSVMMKKELMKGYEEEEVEEDEGGTRWGGGRSVGSCRGPSVWFIFVAFCMSTFAMALVFPLIPQVSPRSRRRPSSSSPASSSSSASWCRR